MKFYTIGYGGREPQELVAALKESGVRAVADVRLRPERASMGVYTKGRSAEKGIEKLLASSGIGYIWIAELGNIFQDPHYWQHQYRQLLNKAGHLLIDRLYEIETPFCLLCAERDVAQCHRKIIADYLVDQSGYKVEHIL